MKTPQQILTEQGYLPNMEFDYNDLVKFMELYLLEYQLSIEFESLLNDRDFLRCLEECGVDNWSPGYEDAQKLMEQDYD